jgi:uncharacterized protein YggE
MIRQLLLIASALLVFSASARAQIYRESEPARPSVSIFGQAEILVAPDEVVFSLKAENVNLDVTVAKAKTDEQVKKIFDLARNHKIEPQNVQTDFIRINGRYETIQNQPPVFKGYAVTQTTTILLKDIPRFESLLADIVKAGISDVSKVVFRVSQVRKYLDQARAQAMRAAREKATALAGEIGQQIGKATSIAELESTVSAALEDEDRSPANYSGNFSTATDVARSAADNQSTIAPGLISITVRVKVNFELN